MRTSFLLAALISVPVLITVTACDSNAEKPPPLRGTVVEKEYDSTWDYSAGDR